MHIHFLDPYRPRASAIHALDPRVKFVLTVAYILTVSLTPPGAWPAYVLLFAVAMSVVVLSELGASTVLKRATLALPFALAALPVIFTVNGPALAQIDIGPLQLTATTTGLERFISIMIKSLLSVTVAIVLAMSTPFPQLLMAMRAVKVPRLLVAIFGLMWRYLFVLVDEAQRLLRARASRSGASSQPGTRAGGTLTWRGKVAGGMAGNLFVRALERGDRIYAAMAARGYDGEVRAFPLPKLSAGQGAVLAAGLAALILLLLLGRLFAS